MRLIRYLLNVFGGQFFLILRALLHLLSIFITFEGFYYICGPFLLHSRSLLHLRSILTFVASTNHLINYC